MERILNSPFKDVLNFRYLDVGNCSPIEKEKLYIPYHFPRWYVLKCKKEGKVPQYPTVDWPSTTGYVLHPLPSSAVRNKNFISIHTKFVKIDYPSGQSAIYFMLSFLLVLVDYDPSVLDRYSHLDLLEPFSFLASLETQLFVSYAKYITAIPMATYLQQDDLPPEPSGFPKNRRLLYRGPIKKFLLTRNRDYTTKNTRFFWSILQGVKRACAVVPDSFVESTLVKHAKILSTPSTLHSRLDPGLSGDWSDQADAADFYSEFNRKCKSLAKGFTFTMDEARSMPEASTSASFESCVLEGGQRSRVLRSIHERTPLLDSTKKYEYVPFTMDNRTDWISLNRSGFPNDRYNTGFDLHHIENLDPEDYPEVMWNEEPESRDFHLYLPSLSKPELLRMSVERDKQYEIYGTALPVDSFEHLLSQCGTPNVFVRPSALATGVLSPEAILAMDFNESGVAIEVPFHPELCAAGVIPIREPLKVRTITKGNAIEYYLSKPFQIAMWRHMQTFPQLCLTGKTLTEDVLYDMLQAERDLEKKLKIDFKFDKLVSGDYSSATDLVDILCTSGVVQPLYQQTVDANPLLKAYVQKTKGVLDSHVLIYPYALKAKFIEAGIDFIVVYISTSPKPHLAVIQVNGQLMGSPWSFPPLCFINVIGYWISLEKYTGKKIKVKDLPVRVNGDDILFRSNDEHYVIWKSTVKQLGFKLSLGKNYIHPRLFTINSILFEFIILNPDTHGYIDETGERIPVRDSYRFRKLDFFNPGLLTGQSKSTGRATDRKLPLGDIYNLCVPTAINPLQAHKWFLHYNKEQIQLITDNGKYNLFIPRHLGGLGFFLCDQVRPIVEVTHFQQRFATFLDSKIHEQLDLGIFPKKYLTAVVAEPLYRDLPNSFVKNHGIPRISVVPFGPLPAGFKEYQIDLRTPSPLTQDIQFLAPISYRLPSRSILKEFNKFFPKDLSEPENVEESLLRRSMGPERLLSNEKLRLAFEPSPDAVLFFENLASYRESYLASLPWWERYSAQEENPSGYKPRKW
jgi:hypothetical protein